MRNKKGFTLVELLVVISIIGVLVALITPAIFFAQKRAVTARSVLEISGISTAIEKYRTDFGAYPPDLSGDQTQDQAAIARHMARNHRARQTDDLLVGGRLNGGVVPAGATPADIDPAEALVIWLGGFSADPRRPLNGAGAAPIFEFDQSRLRDVDGDGYPTYFPKGDKSETPYVYYGSTTTDGATAYDTTAAAVVAINSSGGIQVDANGTRKLIPVPYGRNLNGAVAYANAGKFQIISAGNDGQYVADNYNAAGVMSNPRAYNQNPVSKAEKDNLSSFCENGTFEDSVDD